MFFVNHTNLLQVHIDFSLYFQLYTYILNNLKIFETIIHNIIPIINGNIKASIVHFQLFVSFFIVSSVVEHGK